MNRRNISTDNETETIIETHDLDASKEFRRLIKQEYGAVHVLEERRSNVEDRIDRLLSQKQEIERKMREAEKEKDRLDNLLVKNDVMQQIRNNSEYRVKFEERIQILQRAKKEGDTREEIQIAVKRHAELLADELPFGEEKLQTVLKESVSV